MLRFVPNRKMKFQAEMVQLCLKKASEELKIQKFSRGRAPELELFLRVSFTSLRVVKAQHFRAETALAFSCRNSFGVFVLELLWHFRDGKKIRDKIVMGEK